MIPPNGDHVFPPTVSEIIFPSRYPSPQQQSIRNPPLSSHFHPSLMLAIPLHDAEPLALAPSSTTLTMNIHDHHAPQPVLAYHPSASESSLQIDLGVPNINAREGTAATYHRFPPILTNDTDPTPMNCPTTRSRVTTHPYTRISFRKKAHPAAEYTPDMVLIQARCVADGGDPVAVNLLRAIFADEISTKALTRRMTRDEAREYNHGTSGQMYRVFLRIDEENRFHCRLCAVGADEGGWKQAKDALRYLKRDHFGLGTGCDCCGKMFYTVGELTRHRCMASGGI